MSVMAVAVTELRRVFKFGPREFNDPDPSMAPDDVKELYSGSYPMLRNAIVEGPVAEGDALTYTFAVIAKHKG